MWIRNCNLVGERHDANLDIFLPTSEQIIATDSLATHANKISVDLVPGQDTSIRWRASYDQLVALSCVYFERLSLVGCFMTVSGFVRESEVVGRLEQLSSVEQVDDFLCAPIGPGYKYEGYSIELFVPDQGVASVITLAPPFLGGDDACGLAQDDFCYEFGSEYDFVGSTSFESTETSRYSNSEPDYPSKSFSILGVSPRDADIMFKFCRRQKGRLTLFREFDAYSSDRVVLGFLTASRSPNVSGNFYDFNLQITAKNAR